MTEEVTAEYLSALDLSRGLGRVGSLSEATVPLGLALSGDESSVVALKESSNSAVEVESVETCSEFDVVSTPSRSTKWATGGGVCEPLHNYNNSRG